VKLKFIGKSAKVDYKLLRKAANFYASRLMHPRVVDSLDVKISFIKDLQNENSEPLFGEVDFEEDGETFPPRSFEMKLEKNTSKYWTLLTLGHEFVHIEHLATGKLKNNYVRKYNTVKWRGKLYNESKFNEAVPGEQEALKLEKTLYKEFKQYLEDEGNGG